MKPNFLLKRFSGCVSPLALYASGALALTMVTAAPSALAGACSGSIISAPCTGSYAWTSGDLAVTSGGAISGNPDGIDLGVGTTAGALTNGGSINGGAVGGGIGIGILSSGTIASVTNSGVISDRDSYDAMGFKNDATASIGTLTNSGTISATGSHSGVGIANFSGGSIGTLINSGTISGSGVNGAGIANWATIGALTNSGTIKGDGNLGVGIYNNGAIGTLTNSGLIKGDVDAPAIGRYGDALLNFDGNIVTLINSGTISSTSGAGIYNSKGSIGTLINSGTISGTEFAIFNSNVNAVKFGQIINSGVIAGDISSTVQDLSIAGGSNGAVGTLTGSAPGSVGTMSVSGVTFTSGALLLNDTIVTTGGTGKVVNNASLRVNRSIGLSGNYVQGGAGMLVVGVSSATTSGKLVVSGSADLTNGQVSLVSTNGAALTSGTTYTVVSAGSLSAAGATVESVLPGRARVNGNDLLVSLSSWTQVSDQAGGGTLPVGRVLDRLSPDSAYTPMLTQLSKLTASQQNHAFKQLNVSQVAPQVSASGASVAPITAAVGQRQTALREGDGTGVATGSEFSKGALWGQMLGSHSTLDTTSGGEGYKASSVGLLFGADTHVTDDLVGGLAVSWLRGYSQGKDNISGNSAQTDSYQLSAYGTWRPHGGAAYMDGLLGAAYNQYDQKRAIDFLGSSATASYHGRQYQAKLGAGYDVPLGRLTATPLGSMQVMRVENNAYTERDAGAANLSVGHQGFNALESELGARLATGFDIDGGHIGGDVQVAWVHSYVDSPIVTAAAMGGQGFVSSSARPAADGIRVAAGVTLQRSDDLSLRLEYDGEMRSDYRSHTGLLKLRSAF